MSAETSHPSALVLERLAEDELSPTEASRVQSHVAECMRCEAELEAYRTLFATLGNMPRFAPSPSFADAVMARVEIKANESWAPAWFRRLVPSTRRGWAMFGSAVVIPAIPTIALVVLLMTRPLLSLTTLGQWGMLRFESMSQAGLAWLFDRTVNSGLYVTGDSLLTALESAPTSTFVGVAALISLAIPVSAWGLIRLTRTPVGSVTNA